MKYEDGATRPDLINIQTLIDKYVQDFIDCGKLIGKNGLSVGSGGNLSIKVPGGMLVTSTGSALDNLHIDDIIFVAEANSKNVYFFGSKGPSSESINHWTIYEEMPDVKAVAHVNVGPKKDKNIPSTLEDIPYGTIELGLGIIPLFKKTNVAFLKDHGVVTIGQNLLDATNLLIESADKSKPFILPFVRPLV
ncbi:MAG: class II aldolase/adducin family protein [Candidatus Staskawiczbacteria bacterium]|nr:class II aldolase/adducin family protein [Candidatus Staskawiczbacteria bacterium]